MDAKTPLKHPQAWASLQLPGHLARLSAHTRAALAEQGNYDLHTNAGGSVLSVSDLHSRLSKLDFIVGQWILYSMKKGTY
jgi:hypothetical protein